ncbi:hypothetical protein AYK21_01930 [Thermoplasmatales archaeon SG8-52-2]|nr:MAG: hypothetical protein AYK21_01930 [Thermoplasmatales archaeon SG8-52-2]
MRRKIIISLGLIISIAVLSFNISAQNISSSNTDIKISSTDNFYTVEETIKLEGISDDFIGIIEFWILNGAQDVIISANNENVVYEVSNNLYTTNLSELEIKENSQPTIKINYKLNKNIDNFEKEIIRDTSIFKVTFDNTVLQTSTGLISGASIGLNLYEPTEAESDLNIYLIIVIVILLVLLIIVIINNTRKPKQTKAKKTMIESEELLSTKKTLLMSLLKDIEKKHRSKDISDDTYHKLKSHYKNEAVDTMKKLEDMGSKIK